MPDAARTLVTGALGCVGAWTLKALLDLGEEPVGYDLGGDDARLRLVLDEDERARVTLVEGDVTDGDQLGRALDENGITNVVHLAALQVPFCKADPVLGARLRECVATVLTVEGRSAHEIFGSPDDMKFRSCLTLFEAAADGEDKALFATALDTYYDGIRDPLTLGILGR